MSDCASIVRQLLWNLQKDARAKHLFVPPEPYDDIKVCSALFLVTALQSAGHEARLLMGNGWGRIMPLTWPEGFFVRDLSAAENQPWTSVWLWGFENQNGRGLDRKGKSPLRLTRLRKLFRSSQAIIQVIGLHEQNARLGRISTPTSIPSIDYDKLKIKTDKKKMDADLRGNLRTSLRKHIDEQVGEMKAAHHHYFECDSTGGLVELAFLLGREIKGEGDFSFLLDALKAQIQKFPDIIEDPIMVQFLNLLESKCLS